MRKRSGQLSFGTSRRFVRQRLNLFSLEMSKLLPVRQCLMRGYFAQGAANCAFGDSSSERMRSLKRIRETFDCRPTLQRKGSADWRKKAHELRELSRYPK